MIRPTTTPSRSLRANGFSFSRRLDIFSFDPLFDKREARDRSEESLFRQPPAMLRIHLEIAVVYVGGGDEDRVLYSRLSSAQPASRVHLFGRPEYDQAPNAR